jgi:hypothetical protein
MSPNFFCTILLVLMRMRRSRCLQQFAVHPGAIRFSFTIMEKSTHEQIILRFAGESIHGRWR